MLRRAVLLAVLAQLGFGPGCKRSPAPENRATQRQRPAPAGRYHVRIVELKLRDRTSANDQVVRLPASEMKKQLLGLLAEVDGYRVDLGGVRGGSDAYSLTVHVELQSQVGKEKGKAAVLVNLALRRLGGATDDPGYVRNALSEKVYPVDKVTSLKTVYTALLRRAAGEMLRQMSVESRLRTAPPSLVAHAIRSSRIDELDQGWTGRVDVWQPVALTGQLMAHGDLALPAAMTALILGWSTPDTGIGDGADVREMSIKAAALRKLRVAVPEILKVLQRDRRQRIRDLCLGALAEIRDPAAVPTLTRYAREGDLQRLRKVIGVLGQIGGKQARAFLEVTADGHGDPDIQSLARQTLSRLPKAPQSK